MTPAIQFESVSKFFSPAPPLPFFKAPRPIQALNAIDLTIPPGSIVVLSGTNGAGKTTLLRLSASLLLPDVGRVRINGTDTRTGGAAVRQSISALLGDLSGFYWRLTVRQNLEFFAALHDFTRAESLKRIGHLAAMLQFESLLDRRFESLSTGFKQRVAFARTSLKESPILLLDEPTRSLDQQQRSLLLNWLRHQAASGRTILITSHDASDVQTLGGSSFFLEQGQLQRLDRA